MLNIVRLYESEAQAQQVIDALRKEGFRADDMVLVSSSQGEPQEVVQRLAEALDLPWEHRKALTAALAEGQAVVVVEPPFGSGAVAEKVLEDFGPIHMEKLAPVTRANPAPLSDFLGIPVLSRGTTFRIRLKKDPTPLSSRFDWKVLKDDPTPLSSRFGWKVLKERKKDWNTSFGYPLLKERPQDWKESFGLPLLSDSATPLSDRMGWRVTARERPAEESFGYPLLSKDPTPLSSYIGMPVLSNEGERKGDGQ